MNFCLSLADWHIQVNRLFAGLHDGTRNQRATAASPPPRCTPASAHGPIAKSGSGHQRAASFEVFTGFEAH